MMMSDNMLLDVCEKEMASFQENDNGIEQHLLELGYLPLLHANALTSTQIEKAKDAFEKDLFNSDLFSNEELTLEKTFGTTAFLKHFLRKLTDIDEGLRITLMPLNGELSLKSRLIHYRLDIFGLWEHAINTSFGIVSLHQMDLLAQFGKCSSMEAINHLSDIDNFTKHLLSIHEEEAFILCFNSPGTSETITNKLDRSQRFGAQLKEDFGEKTDYFKYLQHNIFKRNETKVDYGFLQSECKNKFKLFISRLIQIHQWQDGFYSGLLDSKLGDVTIESILQSVEAHNEADANSIKAHKVLTYLGRGYFMFNALFFLQEYIVSENAFEESSVWSSMEHQLNNSDPETQNKFNTNLQELKSAIQSPKKVSLERKGILNRVYFGIKKLLKKAARFKQRIFKWIITKASKIWGFLKRLFTVFFERLRDGLKAFIDGLKFLFGRKVIHTGNRFQYIVSKYQLDGDVSSIAIHANSAIVQKHIVESRYQWQALGFSLAITTLVLKTVMQSFNMLSWPFLLFTIVKTYKSISTKYRNLGII